MNPGKPENAYVIGEEKPGSVVVTTDALCPGPKAVSARGLGLAEPWNAGVFTWRTRVALPPESLNGFGGSWIVIVYVPGGVAGPVARWKTTCANTLFLAKE